KQGTNWISAHYTPLPRQSNLAGREPSFLLGGGSHFGILRSLHLGREVDQWSAQPGSLGQWRIPKEKNLRRIRAPRKSPMHAGPRLAGLVPFFPKLDQYVEEK